MSRPRLIDVDIAQRNDIHDEDRAERLESTDGLLKGAVICDGISRNDGRLAAETTRDSFVTGIGALSYSGIENLRADLLRIAGEAGKAIRARISMAAKPIDGICSGRNSRQYEESPEAWTETGITGSGTTFIVGLCGPEYLFVFYIGDGDIRHYTGDLRSMANYMLSYERGKLRGYLDQDGLFGSPTFLVVDNSFAGGGYLVLATDGAQTIGNRANQEKLWKQLNEAREGRKSGTEAIESYLDSIEREDDATVAVIRYYEEKPALK